MAIQDTESRQWGCLDTIVSIEGCVLFKEDQPFLARHAATLGYGTHHLGRELPPQCLVDFVRRRWWAGYVKDVAGRSVQAVATEPYVYSSEDFRAARDAKGRRNNNLDGDCDRNTLNARVHPPYGIQSRADCPACSSGPPKVARDALERLYTERARFGQLREILGTDVRKLDIHWRGLNPAGINYHAITQFVNRGVPLTHADAKTLLVRMLVDEHIRPYLGDLLEDGCMPDLRSDCVVKYGPEFYRVSDLENPEKKSVLPDRLGRKSRARRARGQATFLAQIQLGVSDSHTGRFAWQEMPYVKGTLEVGRTDEIGSEFLNIVRLSRPGVIIGISIERETDCASSKKSASPLRGELLKLAVNARTKVKFLC